MALRPSSALVAAGLLVGPAYADWTYHTVPDPMGRGDERRAVLESTNMLQFAFPYQGGSRGVVSFTRSPSGTLYAFLGINRGQFVCMLPQCRIMVRFDDSKPEPWPARMPRDGSADHLQLANPSKLLARVSAAKRFQAEAIYFRSGRQVTEFSPAGLKFP